MSTNALDEKISLKFSDKYDPEHAKHYLSKHKDRLSSRLSHWRDVQMARKALKLAGNPAIVLDLPCGAGRFWPMLAEQPGRSIIGADNSGSMIEVAMQSQPPSVTKLVRPLQTSAFDIDLPDSSVDSVFCMRLMHHIGQADHRNKMLGEFYRVTRDSAIISLWVDGNYKAWKRKRLEVRRASRNKNPEGFQNRFVLPAAQVEEEFSTAGFSVIASMDFLPYLHIWRVYVLRKG